MPLRGEAIGFAPPPFFMRFSFFLGIGTFALCGCTVRGANKTSVSIPASPPVRAFVRLEAITQAGLWHQTGRELQADANRLQTVAERLGLPVPDSPQSPQNYTLASLQQAVNARQRRAIGQALDAIEARAYAQRLGLRDTALRGLDDFARNQNARQARLLEQKRVEIEAALLARDVERERLRREEIEKTVASKLETYTNERLRILARLSVLDAQLEPGSVFLPPVFDPENLERDIATLKANPQAPGIGQRPRLELERRTQQTRFDELEQLSREAVATGTQTLAQFVNANQTKRAGEVAAQLEALRSGAATEFLRSGQVRALADLIRRETETSARALQIVQLGVGRGPNGDASYTLPASSASAAVNGAQIDTLIRRGQSRVQKQRAALVAFNEAALADKIRDIAQVRGIDVQVTRGQAEAERARTSGRVDRTQAFTNYLRQAQVPTKPFTERARETL
jgi:hypothetical protein